MVPFSITARRFMLSRLNSIWIGIVAICKVYGFIYEILQRINSSFLFSIPFALIFHWAEIKTIIDNASEHDIELICCNAPTLGSQFEPIRPLVSFNPNYSV